MTPLRGTKLGSELGPIGPIEDLEILMGFFGGGVRCLLVVEKKMDLGTKQGRNDRLFFCTNTNHLNPWADKGWAHITSASEQKAVMQWTGIKLWTTGQRDGIVGNTYIQTCMLYLVKQDERWQHKLMWTC